MRYKPYRYLLYLMLRLFQAVVLCLPRNAALSLARGVGRAAFALARRERNKTLEHLTRAYGGEKSPGEIKKLGERVFIHFAETAVEVLRLPKLDREALNRLVEVGDGFETYRRLLAEGNGVILLTGHLGNWELMGALFCFNGFPGTVVGRRLYYEKFNQMILRLRKKAMLKTLYQDASPREYLEVLRRNEILGLLADQDLDWADGIFVPFFGRPAYTMTAPVKLALASGAPLVPTFLVREGDRYRLLVEEPIRVEIKTTREEAIREYTERWSQVMEEKIRAYPDQWAWMHRRWKTKKSGTSSYGDRSEKQFGKKPVPVGTGTLCHD